MTTVIGLALTAGAFIGVIALVFIVGAIILDINSDTSMSAFTLLVIAGLLGAILVQLILIGAHLPA
ncbi:MAG: hypothetical protein FJX54_03360 [Alphaproteobacteria bacterium]|nr:hypothetical protein [Alphaproteobacteria bacterium]